MAGAGTSARRGRTVLKILVTVKRVEDYESKIKVKPDSSWIVTEGVNYRANPFDEIGVEEGLRLRDSNAPSEGGGVSIGRGGDPARVGQGRGPGNFGEPRRLPGQRSRRPPPPESDRQGEARRCPDGQAGRRRRRQRHRPAPRGIPRVGPGDLRFQEGV